MMPKGWNFIVETPPRRHKGVVEKDWKTETPEGIDFDGQHFSLPSGLSVRTRTRWLEESLLSVEISLTAIIEGECARCLADATLAISDDLMYLYSLRGLEFGKDTELQSDDGFLPVEVDFWGRTLNISDQVWESILMLLPLKLLCREECAGLCPQCGTDLNTGVCSCASWEEDPRLSALRSIARDIPSGD